MARDCERDSWLTYVRVSLEETGKTRCGIHSGRRWVYGVLSMTLRRDRRKWSSLHSTCVLRTSAIREVVAIGWMDGMGWRYVG